MKFNVCFIEPNWYYYSHFLYDIGKWIMYSIESLGHSCILSKNKCYHGMTNIIIGSHLITNISIVNELMSYSYIILFSELVHGPFKFDYIQELLLKNANAVWSGIEGNLGTLKVWNVNSHIIRLGYHENMEEVKHKRVKDIDFLFIGSVTPHRNEMISSLRAVGGNVVVAFDENSMYRNDLIARAKINIVSHNGPVADYFSGARILYLVNNACCVIVEKCCDDDFYKHLYLWTNTDTFSDTCMGILGTHDNEREFYTQSRHCLFKNMPMTKYMKPLLENINENLS